MVRDAIITSTGVTTTTLIIATTMIEDPDVTTTAEAAAVDQHHAMNVTVTVKSITIVTEEDEMTWTVVANALHAKKKIDACSIIRTDAIETMIAAVIIETVIITVDVIMMMIEGTAGMTVSEIIVVVGSLSAGAVEVAAEAGTDVNGIAAVEIALPPDRVAEIESFALF